MALKQQLVEDVSPHHLLHIKHDETYTHSATCQPISVILDHTAKH